MSLVTIRNLHIMPPGDNKKVAGIQVHGPIHHFSKKAGKLIKCRRWAYVNQDSLLIFPDAYTSGHCYRIHLTEANISISYEDEDNPLIAITEKNNNTPYLIQPEKPYKFQKWLSAIHKASQSKSNDNRSTSFLRASNVSETTFPNGQSVNDGQHVSEDTTDFTPNMKLVTNQSSEPVRNRAEINSPMPRPRVSSPDNPPALPKRIAMPWDRGSRQTGTASEVRSSMGSRNNHWVAGQPAPPARAPRRAPLSMTTTDGDVPPPRPPRTALALKTVKEHPDMRDNQVVPTKSLDEVKSRYPVSGLAKRMSISASDLLGKSRDELILLLLQLNREKANLQRWHDYFTQQIDLIRSAKKDTPEVKKELDAIEVELKDVNGQLSLSEPLVTFLSNMLRMGDLYGGDDVLFASEYRTHLLPAHEVVPPKPSLTLAREVEAREIARSLNASKRKLAAQSKSATRSSIMTDGSCTLANWIAQTDQADVESGSRSNETNPALNRKACTTPAICYQESASIRMRRLKLEAELADLEALCAPHSMIHQRLRETQRALRPSESSRPREMQSTLPQASGPSAALLRRLRAEQVSNGRRSGTDSFRGRSREDADRQALEWLDRFAPNDESFRRVNDLSGRTTPRRRNQSASAQSNRFTPIGAEPYNNNRDSSLRRFRSIPDHLNLLAPEETGSNETAPTKSYEWEPLNRPLHTPRLLRGSSNKFSALQPEVFGPNQAAVQPRYVGSRASRYDTDRFPDPTAPIGQYESGKFPVGSNSPVRYTPSDRLFHEWNQPLRDVHARATQPGDRRPISESLNHERSVFGYPNPRMDRVLDGTVNENGDIPRVVRAYSSTTNQFRPNYSSPDLSHTPDMPDSGRLENGCLAIRRTPRNWVHTEWDALDNEDAFGFAVSQDPHPSSPRSKPNSSAFHEYGQAGRFPHQPISDMNGSHTVKLLNQNQWNSDAGLPVFGENPVDTAFVEQDSYRVTIPQARRSERSLGVWLKDAAHSSARGSAHDVPQESNQANGILDYGLVASPTSVDRPMTPLVQRQISMESEQNIKPRMRRSVQDYMFTAESIESVFSPPEPMKIAERYVPTPPIAEPTDALYRRNKEVRLNALREVLLRQRLSGDSDGNSPPKAGSGQSVDRIQQNAHLISMQEQLAKDAVASVFQWTGTRLQTSNKLNA